MADRREQRATCPTCGSNDKNIVVVPCIRFVGDEDRSQLDSWHFKSSPAAPGPTPQDWRELSVGAWFFEDSPNCTNRYSVQERTGGGCRIVCSTPYIHALAKRQMQEIAETHNRAGVAATVETTKENAHVVHAGDKSDYVRPVDSKHKRELANNDNLLVRATDKAATVETPSSGAELIRLHHKWVTEDDLSHEEVQDKMREFFKVAGETLQPASEPAEEQK